VTSTRGAVGVRKGDFAASFGEIALQRAVAASNFGGLQNSCAVPVWRRILRADSRDDSTELGAVEQVGIQMNEPLLISLRPVQASIASWRRFHVLLYGSQLPGERPKAEGRSVQMSSSTSEVYIILGDAEASKAAATNIRERVTSGNGTETASLEPDKRGRNLKHLRRRTLACLPCNKFTSGWTTRGRWHSSFVNRSGRSRTATSRIALTGPASRAHRSALLGGSREAALFAEKCSPVHRLRVSSLNTPNFLTETKQVTTFGSPDARGGHVRYPAEFGAAAVQSRSPGMSRSRLPEGHERMGA